DGSVELLNNRRNIIPILNNENVGYGKAVNRGVEMANSKYICVLNTDLILNEESLVTIWNYLEQNPEIHVCSPVVCYPDGRIQGFFFKFHILFLYSDLMKKIYSTFKKKIISLSKSPVTVDGIAGAFIFLRSSILENQKLFDEDFFFYYEDTDLAHRLKEQKIITKVLPCCKIIHIGGQSSNGKLGQLFFKSKYLYLKKHYGVRHVENIFFLDYLKTLIKAVKYKLVFLFFPSQKVKKKGHFYSELLKHFMSFFPCLLIFLPQLYVFYECVICIKH
ncbi:MAG: glycosyltransferase, partial [Nitrospira sp.]|nr:glycosyltransferase [Nitrospira sp.]